MPSQRLRCVSLTGYRSLSLALLLGLPTLTLAANPGSSPQSRHEQPQHFQIPAQPLSTALIAFSQQSGWQVSAESTLLTGLNSAPVDATTSPENALAHLLRNSGLQWEVTSPESASILPPAESDVLQIKSTPITAMDSVFQGEQVIDRQMIESLPSGNGDITSLLRTNPNVQFDNNQLSSKTPGEIAPADISINGARPWQNLFVVDGMTMNNDLDPGNSNDSFAEISGRSQGMALDTDLLEDIKVYDSNVPVEFGGFNGGVVEANTRDPKKDFHGKVSVQMSRSEWTRYHLNEDDPDLENFEAGFGNDSQPAFKKIITRATLEGYLTDNFGLMGSFSRKDSTIPTRVFAVSNQTDTANATETQTRRIDNYFLKAVWQVNEDWKLDVSLTHAPETAKTFGPNSLYSARDMEAGGESISARLVWNAPMARVEQNLSWSELNTSRYSDSDYLIFWRTSTTKDWSTSPVASEGGFGDIEETQKTLAYKLKADWNSFNWLGLDHSVQSGLELSQNSASYERSKPHSSYTVASTGTCVGNDHYCSIGTTQEGWPGQYANKMTVSQGKVAFDTRAWALYLQDEMRYGRLTVRPGVRIDGDDYMSQTTIAPRLAIELDVFGDNKTRITGGANRYYGRNLYAYRLRDGIAAMGTEYSRASPSSEWVKGQQNANDSKFNQLKVPYDDELTLGLSHVQWDTEFAVKYVKRMGREQVSRAWGSQIGEPSEDTSTLAANYYTYYNGGKSDADIYTLTITPLQAFTLGSTRTSGQFAMDWSKINNTGLSNYSASIGATYVEDPTIQYDGKFMKYSDMPATNYNRPWTARLTTITEIEPLHLTWSNFLRYRDGYRRIAATGKKVQHEGKDAYVWAETPFSGALTWDTRIAWQVPTAKDQAVFVNLDVINLLDKQIVGATENSGLPTYEVGRQFMLEVGYTF
ncbi:MULTISPECIES: TonB-dependent receptor plug domain-containing protein [unclassified Pseudomonas]|uniref:TonB-dependent receptor plug domain-containing protein n=1 Tax=unclassified Pseudomonas TaxID=196821 RepID=UPI00385A4E5B